MKSLTLEANKYVRLLYPVPYQKNFTDKSF